MNLQETMVHCFDIKFIDFGLSVFCHSDIMKTEAV